MSPNNEISSLFPLHFPSLTFSNIVKKINNTAKYRFFDIRRTDLVRSLPRKKEGGRDFRRERKGEEIEKYVEGQKEKGIRGGKQRGAY